MKTESVAYSYAMALSQVDGVDLKQVEEEMSAVGVIFQDPVVNQYFDSPRVSSAEKKEQFKKVFGGKISGTLLNFLFLLVDKNRDDAIPEICAALTDIADKKFGRVRPHITLSRKYPEGEVNKIITMVKELISSRKKDFGIDEAKKDLEFIPTIEIKPELIGGIYLRVGDNIWDSSISRYLNDWKKKVLSSTIDKDAVISMG